MNSCFTVSRIGFTQSKRRYFAKDAMTLRYFAISLWVLCVKPSPALRETVKTKLLNLSGTPR